MTDAERLLEELASRFNISPKVTPEARALLHSYAEKVKAEAGRGLDRLKAAVCPDGSLDNIDDYVEEAIDQEDLSRRCAHYLNHGGEKEQLETKSATLKALLTEAREDVENRRAHHANLGMWDSARKCEDLLARIDREISE